MPTSDALWRRCAGLFMVGFDGTEAPASMLSLIDDGVYGAILFKRNVATPAQVAKLIHALKSHAKRPLRYVRTTRRVTQRRPTRACSSTSAPPRGT